QPTYSHIDTVLGAGLVFPQLRGLFRDSGVRFEDERQQKVVEYLVKSDDIASDEPPEALREIADYVKVGILRAEKRYEGWREEDIRHEIAELLRQHATEQKKQEL